MSPDSIEQRLRDLEKAVTAMETSQADHERDIRQYAPSLIEMARMGEKLNSVTAEMRVINAGVADLRAEWRRDVEHFEHEVQKVRKAQEEDRLDVQKVRAQREEREREKEKVDRRYRITTLIAAGGLLLTTLGLAVAIVTLLDQAPK